MSYTRTTWVSGETPLSADNMNNIEDGIEELKSDLAYQVKGSATNGNTSTVTLDISNKSTIMVALKVGTNIVQTKTIPTSILESGDTISLSNRAIVRTASTTLHGFDNQVLTAREKYPYEGYQQLFDYSLSRDNPFGGMCSESHFGGRSPDTPYGVTFANLYADLTDTLAKVVYNGDNSFTLTNGLSATSTLYLLGWLLIIN